MTGTHPQLARCQVHDVRVAPTLLQLTFAGAPPEAWNFLLDPQVNVREALFHGYPVADKRVNALLPPEVLNDPILYPAADLLAPLEFGAAVTLTDPNRAELMARFKSA